MMVRARRGYITVWMLLESLLRIFSTTKKNSNLKFSIYVWQMGTFILINSFEEEIRVRTFNHWDDNHMPKRLAAHTEGVVVLLLSSLNLLS